MEGINMIKTYRGEKWGDEVYVIVGKKKRKLAPRLDLIAISPNGFSWGNMENGARQLAFALLCDALNESDARKFYGRFMHRCIASLSRDGTFELMHSEITEIVKQIRESNIIAQQAKRIVAQPPRPEKVYGQFSDRGDDVIWDAEHDRKR
jgi:Family of unknown function (DUF6166)